ERAQYDETAESLHVPTLLFIVRARPPGCSRCSDITFPVLVWLPGDSQDSFNADRVGSGTVRKGGDPRRRVESSRREWGIESDERGGSDAERPAISYDRPVPGPCQGLSRARRPGFLRPVDFFTLSPMTPAALGLDSARALDPSRYGASGRAPRVALKPASRD